MPKFTTMQALYDEYDKVFVSMPSSKEDKLASGFAYYRPRLTVRVMARPIRKAEATKYIHPLRGDTLEAYEGYWVIYNTQSHADEIPSIRGTIEQQITNFERHVEHWPIRPDIMAITYSLARVEYPLNFYSHAEQIASEALGMGFFIKTIGRWAYHVQSNEAVAVVSLEHGNGEYSIVPEGSWIAIGVDGEPYHMDNDDFISRYMVANPIFDVNIAAY